MLGDAGGQAVAELGVVVEPLEFVVRAGHLERGPGDLRCPRQRRRGARVDQPRLAPHQRHQEQLGLGVQVERQHGTLAVRLRGAARLRRGGRPPVPAGNRDRDLQPVVQHRARAHHGRSCVHEPPPGRVAVALHARQPDAVPVSRHVQRVRLADVGDPRTLRRCRDHPGAPGKPPPSGDRQVYLRPSPEYQLAAFAKPEDLARRGTHVRGHWASLGRGPHGRHPRIRGWRGRPLLRLAPCGETPGTAFGWQPARAGPVPEGGPEVLG